MFGALVLGFLIGVVALIAVALLMATGMLRREFGARRRGWLPSAPRFRAIMSQRQLPSRAVDLEQMISGRAFVAVRRSGRRRRHADGGDFLAVGSVEPNERRAMVVSVEQKVGAFAASTRRSAGGIDEAAQIAPQRTLTADGGSARRGTGRASARAFRRGAAKLPRAEPAGRHERSGRHAGRKRDQRHIAAPAQKRKAVEAVVAAHVVAPEFGWHLLRRRGHRRRGCRAATVTSWAWPSAASQARARAYSSGSEKLTRSPVTAMWSKLCVLRSRDDRIENFGPVDLLALAQPIDVAEPALTQELRNRAALCRHMQIGEMGEREHCCAATPFQGARSDPKSGIHFSGSCAAQHRRGVITNHELPDQVQ